MARAPRRAKNIRAFDMRRRSRAGDIAPPQLGYGDTMPRRAWRVRLSVAGPGQQRPTRPFRPRNETKAAV